MFTRGQNRRFSNDGRKDDESNLKFIKIQANFYSHEKNFSSLDDNEIYSRHKEAKVFEIFLLNKNLVVKQIKKQT